MNLWSLWSYDNPLKRGIRIALRAKVNDSLITGLRVVDSILPVGRGQRQLIQMKLFQNEVKRIMKSPIPVGMTKRP